MDEALAIPLTMFPVAAILLFIAGYALGEGRTGGIQTATVLSAFVALTAYMGFTSMYTAGFGHPITDDLLVNHLSSNVPHDVVSRTKLPNGHYAVWARNAKTQELVAFELNENLPDCFQKSRSGVLLPCEKQGGVQ